MGIGGSFSVILKVKFFILVALGLYVSSFQEILIVESDSSNLVS